MRQRGRAGGTDLMITPVGIPSTLVAPFPEPSRRLRRRRVGAGAVTDRFGETCPNRGCIPSKMLVVTADIAQTICDAGRFGIRTEPPVADWPAIRDRVFSRIDRLPTSMIVLGGGSIAAEMSEQALLELRN